MRAVPIRELFCSGLILVAAAMVHAQTQGATTAPAAPPAASDKLTVTGLAAWEKIVGNTLVGTVEGRAFAEFYAKDGTVKFRIDGKLAVGRWVVTGEQICFDYPGDPRECFIPTLVDGANLTWSDGKGMVDTQGTLKPGNSEEL